MNIAFRDWANIQHNWRRGNRNATQHNAEAWKDRMF